MGLTMPVNPLLLWLFNKALGDALVSFYAYERVGRPMYNRSDLDRLTITQ